jgi:transposase-like protein
MPQGKRHSVQFKFKVALAAAKGNKTLSELVSEFGLHPSQISEWKTKLLRDGISVFSTTTTRQQREQEVLETELYTCYETWPSRGPTRCGAATLPTSVRYVDSCI